MKFLLLNVLIICIKVVFGSFLVVRWKWEKVESKLWFVSLKKRLVLLWWSNKFFNILILIIWINCWVLILCLWWFLMVSFMVVKVSKVVGWKLLIWLIIVFLKWMIWWWSKWLFNLVKWFFFCLVKLWG